MPIMSFAVVGFKARKRKKPTKMRESRLDLSSISSPKADIGDQSGKNTQFDLRPCPAFLGLDSFFSSFLVGLV
jgi:hypothetical protein